MEAIPGLIDVTLEAERGRPEIGITTDVRRAALWGLSVTDVANALRTSIGGTQAAFYRERGEEAGFGVVATVLAGVISSLKASDGVLTRVFRGRR